jgi:hypothetical protein
MSAGNTAAICNDDRIQGVESPRGQVKFKNLKLCRYNTAVALWLETLESLTPGILEPFFANLFGENLNNVLNRCLPDISF